MSSRTRRILAVLAILGGLALLYQQSRARDDEREVTFALDFGRAAEDVRHVRVDLWAGDESIGFREETFGPAGATPVRWHQPVPRADLEATIALTLATGEVVAHRRKLHAPGGADVVIDARP